jgi:hypothetical protein
MQIVLARRMIVMIYTVVLAWLINHEAMTSWAISFDVNEAWQNDLKISLVNPSYKYLGHSSKQNYIVSDGTLQLCLVRKFRNAR